MTALFSASADEKAKSDAVYDVFDSIEKEIEKMRPADGEPPSPSMCRLIADLEAARTPANDHYVTKMIKNAKLELYHDLLGDCDSDDSEGDGLDGTMRLIEHLRQSQMPQQMIQDVKCGKYDSKKDDHKK